MAPYLSQAWLDRQAELAADVPEQPGASARVQYVVTGAPDGDARYHVTVEKGRVVAGAPGEDPDAELTVTVDYETSARITRGDLDANAAYMQGALKVAGSTATLMAILAAAQRPAYRAAQAALADDTEW